MEPRRGSEFEFLTRPNPDPRNIVQITVSGNSEFQFWAPPGPNPALQSTLSGSSGFEIWTHPSPDPRHIMQITFSGSPRFDPDTSGPRSSTHYANYNLRELRIQCLGTSARRSIIMMIIIIHHHHLPLLLILLPSNRSTRLSSSGSIHKMMISRGRR